MPSEFAAGPFGKRARKGVLITTSKFSKDAIACASNLGKNVTSRLSELMFEYDLGVTTESTYHMKCIGNDFFDEDEV
jgi:restriction system protein